MSKRKNEQTEEKLVERLVSVDRVSFNISQAVIVTTEDKLQLALNNYHKNISNSKEWITPLSLLIAIITTLVTAEFNSLILSSETWKAIFIISGIASTFWLIWTLWLLRKQTSIDRLIKEIKTGSRIHELKSNGEENGKY